MSRDYMKELEERIRELEEAEDKSNSHGETSLLEEETFEDRCFKKNRGYVRKHLGVQLGNQKNTNYRETFARIEEVCDGGLHITEKGKKGFVLLPFGLTKEVEAGMEIYLILDGVADDEFILEMLTKMEYEDIFGNETKLSIEEKQNYIKMYEKDPEGFLLWNQLGAVKRIEKKVQINNTELHQHRAEMLLSRIPKERDDLYNALKNVLSRYRSASSNERADYEETLTAVENLIVMMLTNKKSEYPCLTKHSLEELFPDARITWKNECPEKDDRRTLNILLAGKDYKNAVHRLKMAGRKVNEINMGGVQGNDYLFGDEMSYYCSGIGELAYKLMKEGSFATDVLFKHVDLMGTTVRSSNPLYGLCTLLLEHNFQDYHLRHLTIDTSKTTFICQADSVNTCPELLKQVMDVIIEL